MILKDVHLPEYSLYTRDLGWARTADSVTENLSLSQEFRFRIQGSGFRVEDLGFGVEG